MNAFDYRGYIDTFNNRFHDGTSLGIHLLMTNERNTEILTRGMLRDLGYYAEPAILVKEQDSDNPRIEKLLKNASKKGNGCGKPEFIIRSTKHPDLLIVIECKGSTTKHISKNRDKYAAFACDGALLYASFLSKEYDVIAVGISGEKIGDHKISCFVHLKGADAAYDLNTDILLTWEDFRNRYLESPQKFKADYTSLLSYSQTLNLKLHKLKVKESQRSLLISAILIALKNHAFSASFTIHRNAKTLASVLVQTVISELVFANVSKDKIENLAHAYSFVKTQSILTTQEGELVDLIQEVDAEINGFMKSHKYLDTLGQFYIEFLRYANNDKGLGIVLARIIQQG